MTDSWHKGPHLEFAPWPYESTHWRKPIDLSTALTPNPTPSHPPTTFSVQQGSACASTGCPSACTTSSRWWTAGSSSPAPSTGRTRECTTARRTSWSPKWGTWCGPTSDSLPVCGCAMTLSDPERDGKGPSFKTFLWESFFFIIIIIALQRCVAPPRWEVRPLCFNWKDVFRLWIWVMWPSSPSPQATAGSGISRSSSAALSWSIFFF